MTALPKDLSELEATSLIELIKDNIGAALAAIRANRADQKVQTEEPKSYFFYEEADALKCPTVYVIPDSFDTRLQIRMANHINAEGRVFVTVVVEDKNGEYVTIKAWRYQAALFEVLDNAEILTTDGRVKMIVKILNCKFSPIFTLTGNPSPSTQVFRKEVSIECSIEHYEQP